MKLDGKRIIVSRTDSIGDVMLTLPICHWIKEMAPSSHLIFLGKGYTKSVVEAYQKVDQFEDWGAYAESDAQTQLNWFKALNADIIIHVFPSKNLASLAKKAGISMRIGTSHRLYHLLTCTHRVNFTRKKSDLHESQLNFELLRPMGLSEIPELEEVSKATEAFQPKKETLTEPFQSLKDYVILHPKSRGSAREWPMEKYVALAKKLTESGKNVVFTGTENEGKLFRDQLPSHDKIYDSTGQLSLEQLITLIGKSQGLIACSTGPLHIAGYSGIRAVGLFSPQRPIHPGRWKALGPDVRILVCPGKSSEDADYNCLQDITVESAFDALTT